MIDLVVRGGTVVDGSGGESRRADVAIADGRIRAIGEVRERGAREIDAGGLIVCPGIIDVHTHYDAQYTWDPYATSSIWHGVTTTVIGNCGFAIAPCRPADRDLIMRTLVKVEGMSLAAMRAGITWGFETFPEYLDHLERCNPSLNVAAFLGHSTIRQWVMGNDSQHRVGTAGEVDAMCGLVREAMRAGAIGVGSSTAEAHIGENGLPVASRLADMAELLALTRAMGESGHGLFEITIGSKTSLEDLREIWRTSGRPVMWAAFFQRDDRPEYVPERLAITEAFHREGVEVAPQVSCRPLTMDFTMRNPYPFEGMPSWQRVMREPESRWLSVLGDPGFRTALKSDLDEKRLAVFRGRWDLVQVLRVTRPEHRALEGATLADLARRTGKHPVDAWLDLVTADGLDVEFLAGLLNTDEKVVGDLVAHPLTLITLSDAGAHLSLMCDAGYSSTLLGTWVRDRKRLSLEAAVKRLTSDPARVYRIPERGRLEPGYCADVVAFDPATIDALPVEWVRDLPGDEGRFVSRARGVEWSLVNGEPVLEHGRVVERPAGDRPGKVLRTFGA